MTTSSRRPLATHCRAALDTERIEILRYRVDLKKYLADCEANYVRMLRLFPAIDHQEELLLALGEGEKTLSFQVLERTPYTTLVSIVQEVEGGSCADWLLPLRLKVRLYHDVRMAEVVNWLGQRQLQPRYEYPNKHMRQPDEKAQWNSFLADWLSYAIHHGYATLPLCEFAG